MKTRPLLALLALSLAALLTPGCASAPQPETRSTQRIRAATAWIVYAGAKADLLGHPERRPAWEAARAGLDRLVQAERWDLEAAAEALLAAGVSEFRGEEAVLILAVLPVFTDLLGVASFDARDSAHARALIEGAQRGLTLALGPRQRGIGDPIGDGLRREAEATR